MDIYLRELMPLRKPNKMAMQAIFDEGTDEDLYIMAPRRADVREVQGLFAFMLLRRGVSRSYLYINAYELIEIYLQKSKTGCSSVFELDHDILIITFGFGEFSNQRQEELLVQTMENRKRLGKVTWFLTRKELKNGDKTMMNLKDLLEGYKEVNLSDGKSTPPPKTNSSSGADGVPRF